MEVGEPAAEPAGAHAHVLITPPLSLAAASSGCALYTALPNAVHCMRFSPTLLPLSSPPQVGGLAFSGYGAHCDAYPCDYLTVAAALGTSEQDIDEFLRRLGQCFAEFRQRRQKKQQAAGEG